MIDGPCQDSFPWPPATDRSPIAALIETWRLATFEPTNFFRALPVPSPIGSSVIYFLIIGVVSAGIGLFWQTLAGIFSRAMGSSFIFGGAIAPQGWEPVVSFLISPLYLLIGLGISFVVTHLSLMIFRGANRGAGTTIRVLAYAYSPAIFVIVPIIGSFVGGIWSVVLAIIGLREAHRTDGWRAAIAVFLPLIVIFVLAMIAAIFIGVIAALIAR